jgi:signal-transduction protein with cAMP-binding, CBS, and nucleotidyltransferase domain
MDQEPVNVSPRADLEDCMSVMAERRIRHLPVAEQGHVLGVISSTDLLKLAIQQKDYVIEQLELYILLRVRKVRTALHAVGSGPW